MNFFGFVIVQFLFFKLNVWASLLVSLQSVHPLVPLLLYSDRHFPSSSLYSQPISAAAAAAQQVSAQSGQHTCYHSNSAFRWVCGGLLKLSSASDGNQWCEWTLCALVPLALGSRQPVKKPLNAFMLYMKEMRHKVLQEGQERESAAINRILGRRVRSLMMSEWRRSRATQTQFQRVSLVAGWCSPFHHF